MSSDLSVHRDRIDAIDREVVRLLNERATAARAIGAAKAARGEAVFAPGREQQVFERIAAANAGPLPDRALRAVWREVMSACRALEQPLTVCHFGQPGAFTHLAARLKFGDAVAYAAADDIGAVFGEVEKGRADYGVVPIENSTDGSITDTIDAFLATRLRIVAELHLRIRHHLMGTGSRDGLKRVYSRNTVFGQCRRWLAANLPGVELVDVSSTTKAAERAAAEPDAGAIGSEDAAKAFGLPLLASDIQDDPNNVTRFVVIAAADKASAKTGDDKTSLMFGIADRPGALYDCLTPFHQGGLNLTRIESRPNRRRAWEYLFFIDLVGHHRDAAVEAAVATLRGQANEVEILGSYPRAAAPLNG